jgi:hypothetical protein
LLFLIGLLDFLSLAKKECAFDVVSVEITFLELTVGIGGILCDPER